MNNKYKKLIKNSAIFAIGNLASKALAFLMVPLYTLRLTKGQYGLVDILTNTANILVPVITLSVFDAVFRYAMDKDADKSEILTNGIFVTFISLIILVAIIPLLLLFKIPYLFYFVTMVECLSIQTLFQNFTRAIGKVGFFTFSGLINAVGLASFNAIFIFVLHYGVAGYLLSFILSSIITILYLLKFAKLSQFINFTKISFIHTNKLLRYSLPLIPNSLSWWMTNGATRYIILALLGIEANGIYAVAGQLPALITVIFNVFAQAWQISAVEEITSKDAGLFYSDVLEKIESVLVILSAILIVVIKPFVSLMFSASYYAAWKTIPFLVLAVMFSNLAAFTGTFYLALKKTNIIFSTTIIGMLINVLLSFIFIKKFGIAAAGLGSTVGFLVVFIIRLKNLTKYIDLNMRKIHFSINILLIVLMCGFLWWHPEINYFLLIIIFLNNLAIIKYFLIGITTLPQYIHKFIR